MGSRIIIELQKKKDRTVRFVMHCENKHNLLQTSYSVCVRIYEHMIKLFKIRVKKHKLLRKIDEKYKNLDLHESKNCWQNW